MNKFFPLVMLALFALIFNSCNSPYRRVIQREYPDYPLYNAVQKGDVAEAKRLVAWHRQNNQPIPDNLLFAAVDNTDKVMADLVLGLGLDWNKELNGSGVFYCCNRYMQVRMYDHGYPGDARLDNGATLFWNNSKSTWLEIKDEDLELLELMLSRGANINFVHNGQTALDTWQKTFFQYFAEIPFKPIVKESKYNDPEAWEKRKSKMTAFLRKHGGKLASELPKDAANKPD